MRYLMLKRCEGVYDYIPLEIVSFHFIETDDHEYRVEITLGGKHSEVLFEKYYFGSPTMHACMKRLAAIPDGDIITPGRLFDD
jgi:hypothetical protein